MSILNIPPSLPTSSTTSSSNSTATGSNLNGFAALTSQDFLKMLIVELKNQDPTQPVSNSELLQQLSQMQALQSNVELKDTLSNFATNSQVSSGASFLGKTVTGTNSKNLPVTGVADRVFQSNGTLMIGIGSDSVSVANITGVSLTPQTTTPASTGG
jgi:flagellar basal-body rod modification protein FlgD